MGVWLESHICLGWLKLLSLEVVLRPKAQTMLTVCSRAIEAENFNDLEFGNAVDWKGLI